MLQTLGADAVVPLGGDEAVMEAAFRRHFENGVDVVLDYLWGSSARAMLVAGAKAAAEGVPIRFVEIGSASGGEISMPAAVLRSSAIEMKGSGLGSVGLPRLVAAVDGVFKSSTDAMLTLDYWAVPLADVAATWREERQRIVYVTR